MTVLHVNRPHLCPEHPEPLPEYRIVRSCEAIHGTPRCIGAAAMGPERCTCETLTQEQHDRCLVDAWQAWLDRDGEPCRDCAFRAGSPEQDQLRDIVAQVEPFRCHQGMPVDARRGVPVQDAYMPVAEVGLGRIDGRGYPVCAGWRSARAALLRKERTDGLE